LRFGYDGAPALFDGWSAQIAPGVTQVVGDTGSGKTTLLRVLAGELPAAGHVVLEGVDLAAAPDRYRQQVFYIDPSTERFHQQTARDCLAALGAGADRAAALVQGFGLAPHLDKALYMLSTGSRRKVWLAAALVSDRPLVLLDDPAAALDAGSTRCLWQAVADRAGHGGRRLLIASSEPLDHLPLAGVISLPV